MCRTVEITTKTQTLYLNPAIDKLSLSEPHIDNNSSRPVCRTVEITARTKSLYLNLSIDKLSVSESESKATDKQCRSNINSVGNRASYNSIKSSYMYVAQSAGVSVTLISIAISISLWSFG